LALNSWSAGSFSVSTRRDASRICSELSILGVYALGIRPVIQYITPAARNNTSSTTPNIRNSRFSNFIA
jgi:hypothetical protein